VKAGKVFQESAAGLSGLRYTTQVQVQEQEYVDCTLHMRMTPFVGGVVYRQ